MIKTGWCLAALVASSLALQGCAQTAPVRSGDTPTADAGQAATPAADAAIQGPVAIPEKDGKPVVAASTKQQFEAVAAAVRHEMRSGGRFSGMNDARRSTVTTSFAAMQALFDQYGSVDAMPPQAKAKLAADESAVDEILALDDGTRLICRNEKPIGSHFIKRVCHTLADLRQQDQQSERDREALQRAQQQGSHTMPAAWGEH